MGRANRGIVREVSTGNIPYPIDIGLTGKEHSSRHGTSSGSSYSGRGAVRQPSLREVDKKSGGCVCSVLQEFLLVRVA